MSFWKTRKETQTGDILLQGSPIRTVIGAGGLSGAFWEKITRDNSRMQDQGQDRSLLFYPGLKSVKLSKSPPTTPSLSRVFGNPYHDMLHHLI